MKLQKTIGLPLLATLTHLLCPTLSAQTPKAVSDILTTDLRPCRSWQFPDST